MINANDFIAPILERGYRFWTGVPCSFLTPLINYVIQDDRLTYVGAASEGEAVGIALGAHLAGKKTVVMCQNSGLGNTVNPLTSLNFPFRVPTLLIVTHRGAPGVKDEPQHALMGLVMTDLLDALKIRWGPFPERVEDVAEALSAADRYMSEEHLPYALVMQKGAVAPYVLAEQPVKRPGSREVIHGQFGAADRVPRREAIRLIASLVGPEDLVVATTGKIGRELFDVGHRPGQLYVVGGMGCASAIGLGVSLNQPHRRVVVLDGDGAVLMKMGTLGTIGHYAPDNLMHVVLDNEAHESTGAQATVSPTVDFAAVAAACSYRFTARCDTAASIESTVGTAFGMNGPSLIHVKVGISTTETLGRPTLTPIEVKEQFIETATSAVRAHV